MGYTERLEEENARLHMQLDQTIDELEKLKSENEKMERVLSNVTLIVKKAEFKREVKRDLTKELMEVRR